MSDHIDVHEGFYEGSTGGGCEAWMRDLPNGKNCQVEIVITGFDGVCMPDKRDDYILVGFTLHHSKFQFDDNKPPIISELEKLIDDKGDLFDVNENYFCYGISLKNATLQEITDIVKRLTLERFDPSSPLERHNLTLRTSLMKAVDILKGAPTLMNDGLIDELIEQIKVAEEQLLQTCEGCGGERAHRELDEIILIPENGWCAMELPECEVVA